MRMRGTRTPSLLAIAALALTLLSLVACAAFVVAPMTNDLICSGGEKGAMSEFPHHGGAQPGWESNLKVTGGCTATYAAGARPEEVREYYHERLTERGWAVELGPDNSFPIHLEARRGRLAFFLNFIDPEMEDFAGTETGDALQPGQTLVGIQGGNRD